MPFNLTGPQGQTFTLPDTALSLSLLTALERRYLPALSELGLVQVRPDANPMANLRFLRLLEVAHTPDLERSLHALNMQNVISSFRDGAHSLVFIVTGEEHHVKLYLDAGLNTEPGRAGVLSKRFGDTDPRSAAVW
jgi:hypothetical protein